jgi:hypothetical protein
LNLHHHTCTKSYLFGQAHPHLQTPFHSLQAGLIGAAHGFSSSSMGQQASFGLQANGGGMGQMESMGAFAPKGCGAGGVNLRTAGDFAILSKSGITNVPG